MLYNFFHTIYSLSRYSFGFNWTQACHTKFISQIRMHNESSFLGIHLVFFSYGLEAGKS